MMVDIEGIEAILARGMSVTFQPLPGEEDEWSCFSVTKSLGGYVLWTWHHRRGLKAYEGEDSLLTVLDEIRHVADFSAFSKTDYAIADSKEAFDYLASVRPLDAEEEKLVEQILRNHSGASYCERVADCVDEHEGVRLAIPMPIMLKGEMSGIAWVRAVFLPEDSDVYWSYWGVMKR